MGWIPLRSNKAREKNLVIKTRGKHTFFFLIAFYVFGDSWGVCRCLCVCVCVCRSGKESASLVIVLAAGRSFPIPGSASLPASFRNACPHRSRLIMQRPGSPLVRFRVCFVSDVPGRTGLTNYCCSVTFWEVIILVSTKKNDFNQFYLFFLKKLLPLFLVVLSSS